MTDFTAMTLAELVVAHNTMALQMAGVATVSRFQDKRAAIERCQRLEAQLVVEGKLIIHGVGVNEKGGDANSDRPMAESTPEQHNKQPRRPPAGGAVKLSPNREKALQRLLLEVGEGVSINDIAIAVYGKPHKAIGMVLKGLFMDAAKGKLPQYVLKKGKDLNGKNCISIHPR